MSTPISKGYAIRGKPKKLLYNNVLCYNEYVMPDGEKVVEAEGRCRICGQYDLLGDGLCVSCWDGKPDRISVHTQREIKLVRAKIVGGCKFCGSTNLVKYGTSNKQRWLCKKCGHTFVQNQAMPGMRYAKNVVEGAVGMRKKGFTFSEIYQRLIDEYGVELSSSGRLSEWFNKLNVASCVTDIHCRRDGCELAERLMGYCGQGGVCTTSELLVLCGYSPRTKIEDTQIYKKGWIIRKGSGWVTSDSLMFANS